MPPPASRSPTFGTNGVVDLREGLGTGSGHDRPHPVGHARQDFREPDSARIRHWRGVHVAAGRPARVRRDCSGKLVWQFHTVPHPGEFGYETWPKDAYKYIGGTNTWGEITVDAKRGIAYFPTGSPTYDYYGADRPGSNLFANCLLALDARTGKRLWHFQTVHHDLWDFDNNAAPQLTTIKKDGKEIDVVAHGREDRIPVCVRPRHRRADVADRGAPGAEERDARRTELADAALSDEPATVRAAVDDDRRHRRRTRLSPMKRARDSRSG